MAALTLRTVKGTPLTNSELDANFTSLNTELGQKLVASSNLSDLANAATARANLGLGNVENKSSATIRGELTSGNVTTALGFTPYNATNPNGFISGITSGMVTTALGYTPYNSSNPSGYITASASITGQAGFVGASDTRTISPSSHGNGRLTFGFTSWANNNTAPWADYLHLRSYTDSTGGTDNLVMFRKDTIGMRIWQQTFGSGTAYSNYVDVLHSGNYSSYALPLSGGTLTGTVASTGFIGQLFGAASGAPDTWIWSVSPAYPTWGIYYNEGTLDAIEFKAAGTTTASIFLDTGAANFAGALTQNNNQVLHAGNYSSYALPLTGGALTGSLSIQGSNYINLASATYSNVGVIVGNWSGTGWWGFGSESGHILKFDQVSGNTFQGVSDITLKLGTKTVLDSGNYSSYALPLSGGELSGSLRINTSGSGSNTSHVIIKRSGQTPASFGSYSGSWRSSLEIWNNDSTKLLFLNSAENDSGYANIKSVGGGFFIDVGSNGATRAIQIEASGAANFPQSLTQGGNQVLHAGNYTSYAAIGTGFTNGGDLNTFTTSGMYRINNTEANRPGDWGQLLVIHGGSDTITQLYGQYNGSMYYRSGNPTNVGGSGSYSAWKTLLDSSNYSSYALPLSGGTLSGQYLDFSNSTPSLRVTSGPGTFFIGDDDVVNLASGAAIATPSSRVTSGVAFLSTFAYGVSQGDNRTHFGYNTGSSYVNYIRGAATYFDSGTLQAGGNQVLHAGNYTSYSPSLSGNYKNLSVGGLYSRYNYNESTYISDATSAYSLSPDYGQTTVAMHSSHGSFGDWATTLTMSGYERYGAYQISGWYNATTPTLAIRNYNQSLGGWTSWVRLLSSANYTSYRHDRIVDQGGSGNYLLLSSSNEIEFFNSSGVLQDMYLQYSGGANSLRGPGGNVVLHAGNYSSYALPLAGGTVTGRVVLTNDGQGLGSETLHVKGDIRAQRGTGNTGVIYFGSSTGTYLYYDGSNYHMPTGQLDVGGNRVLTAGNYTSYSPSLTGSGASGTWGITTTADWLHSDRDFASGTLITTNINYAVTYGDPFVLEIRGNSYGDAVPYDIQYQGYIYSDTIINHGGYSNGTYISGLVALNVGGNLCFWFPRQSYWNGFNVRVYVPYSGRQSNRVSSISSTAKPSGTKEVALSANIRQSLHSGNYSSYALPLSGGTVEGTANVRTSVIKQYQYVRHIEGKNYDTYDTGASGLYLNYASNQPVYIGSSAHVALHAGNYTSYALPLSGGTMSGAISTNVSGTSIFIGSQNVSTSNALRINWHTDSDLNYYIGKRGGTWTQPMDIAFYTGIRYHAHNAYGGHRWYTTGVDSTLSFSVGDGDNNVRVANTLFIGGNTALHAGNYTSYALPLSGGTVSGVTTFSSGSDAQVILNGAGTTWAGIAWTDVSGTDYTWFNGSTSTFAIGGGGSAVSGKKLHVNGGMTIGANYGGTSNSTNGLNVEGAIQQAGNQVLHAGNYTSYSPTLTGSGASGTWGISITGRAYPRRSDGNDLNFNWSGQSGQPPWLWGGSDGANMYVYNPSNFSVNYANYAGYLPTAYIGGQQLNPQTYFSQSTGLRVAMTAAAGVWSDTLWINGYSGGDVLQMCALHFQRNGTPRMYISNQASNATSYGTLYEILSSYNYTSYALPLSGGNVTGSTQIASLGVGTAASGTAGEIRATNNITAYYSSDIRFKENIHEITSATSIVCAIGGKYFDWSDAYLADHGGEDGYFLQKQDFGVIAQDVEKVFPRAVRKRPDGSLAVDYEKLSALAFAAIREQQARLERLESLVNLLIGD